MLKRFIVFCLISLFATLSAVACFAQEEINSLSCDQVVNAPDVGQMTMKFYMKDKGGKVRIETEAQGKKILMIKKGNRMITVYPEQNMAMEIPMSEEQMAKMNQGFSQFGGDPSQFREYLEKMNMAKVGEESVGGKPCDVYEFPSGDGKAKAWMLKDSHFPAKTIIPTSKGDTVVEFKNIKINESISDDLFMVPPGVQVMDMGDMMKGAQQMMNEPGMKEKMQQMMNKYKKD